MNVAMSPHAPLQDVMIFLLFRCDTSYAAMPWLILYDAADALFCRYYAVLRHDMLLRLLRCRARMNIMRVRLCAMLLPLELLLCACYAAREYARCAHCARRVAGNVCRLRAPRVFATRIILAAIDAALIIVAVTPRLFH